MGPPALLRWLGAAAVGVVAGSFACGLALAQGGAMTKQVIKVASHPKAVCNDGSAPVFYFRPGSGDDRNKWIIFLEGGGGCMTGGLCAQRAQGSGRLVTSAREPATKDPGGLLSSDPAVNPDFANFTKVYAHYCSSDFWAGDGEQPVAGSTWQFRGHEVVGALVDQLLGTSIGGAPTLAEATEVLVAGTSAGAMGVHNNLDRIAAAVPNASVKGIADSAWIPAGTEPYGGGSLGIVNYSPEAMKFHGSRPDESCVAANAGNPSACLNEGFVFPSITTPMFVFADQRDPVLLGMLGITPGQLDAGQRAYVMRYAQSVRQSLQRVPAYFVTANTTHTALLNARFSQATLGGQTLGQTIGAWYFGRPATLQLTGRPGEGRVDAREAQ
jgi:hypothetical protein